MIDRFSMIGFDRKRLPAEALRELGAGRGRVSLATCERLEVYSDGAVCAASELIGDPMLAYARELTGREAVGHLFRVASGLESRMLGEDHVLGQVRRSMAEAREAGDLGQGLERLLRGAIRCGRRVRRETALGRAAGSYAETAVEQLAERIDLAKIPIGVVGTGAIAREVCDGLDALGASDITIFGRHAGRTAALAIKHGARAASLDDLAGSVGRLGGLITALASPRVVLSGGEVSRFGPLVIVDLGMPANIDAGVRLCSGVAYFGLDDLTPGERPVEAVIADAERVVFEEIERFVGIGDGFGSARRLGPTRAAWRREGVFA